MSEQLSCYRCGEALQSLSLSLPLSRRDQCPSCSCDLHVCKMCVNFDSSVPRQCREDGADDVSDKERPNFCDWFKPSDKAFDAKRKSSADEAAASLDALFGSADDS